MKRNPKQSPGFTSFLLLLPCLLLGLQAGCTANRPADSALRAFQGTWEGFGLSREASGGHYVKGDNKVIITITGDSFSFGHRAGQFPARARELRELAGDNLLRRECRSSPGAAGNPARAFHSGGGGGRFRRLRRRVRGRRVGSRFRVARDTKQSKEQRESAADEQNPAEARGENGGRRGVWGVGRFHGRAASVHLACFVCG